MPWLAQYAHLPDTHKHHADEGSERHRVFMRLGYVEVPAPGSDSTDEPEDLLTEQESEQDVEEDEEPPALREE